ncbi:MAG: hypothetical protein ABWZ98_05220 [Nakamurella sp.]
MTSSKKKHHPPGAAASGTSKGATSAARSAKTSLTKAPSSRTSTPRTATRSTTAPGTTSTAALTATRRQWIIRSLGVLSIAVGLSLTFIGVTPDIAGGWGKLLLSVPGMVLATGGLIAIIETTPWARSRRR